LFLMSSSAASANDRFPCTGQKWSVSPSRPISTSFGNFCQISRRTAVRTTPLTLPSPPRGEEIPSFDGALVFPLPAGGEDKGEGELVAVWIENQPSDLAPSTLFVPIPTTRK